MRPPTLNLRCEVVSMSSGKGLFILVLTSALYCRHFEKEAQLIIKKYDSVHDQKVIRELCDRALCKLFLGAKPDPQVR